MGNESREFAAYVPVLLHLNYDTFDLVTKFVNCPMQNADLLRKARDCQLQCSVYIAHNARRSDQAKVPEIRVAVTKAKIVPHRCPTEASCERIHDTAQSVGSRFQPAHRSAI